jgi:hypothetical protein
MAPGRRRPAGTRLSPPPRAAAALPSPPPRRAAHQAVAAELVPKGKGRKRGAEPDGATKTWLRLPFGSRKGLQHRLRTRSRCKNHRLAGLQLEPPVEPEPEPCQTGPNSAAIMPPSLMRAFARLHYFHHPFVGMEGANTSYLRNTASREHKRLLKHHHGASRSSSHPRPHLHGDDASQQQMQRGAEGRRPAHSRPTEATPAGSPWPPAAGAKTGPLWPLEPRQARAGLQPAGPHHAPAGRGRRPAGRPRAAAPHQRRHRHTPAAVQAPP